MNRIISFFKSIPIVRIVSVFAASVLIFFTTACSGGELQAKTLNSNNPNRPSPEQYVPKEAVTTPREGGMNQYSDVDPRANTAGAETKAKALLDNAERNLYQRTGNPAEAIKRAANDTPDSPQELGRNLKRGSENIGDKAKGSTEDFAQGTRRGMENIKANTRNAAGDVSDSAMRAAENVKQNTRDAAGNVADKAQRAAENTSDFVKDKSHEAINNTQRALDRADRDIR